MIITIHLEKLQPGLYRASALHGTEPVTQSSTYSTLEEAISQEAAAVPAEIAWFADVIYGGASSGTISLRELSARAAEIATRLVTVVAQMHSTAEAACTRS